MAHCTLPCWKTTGSLTRYGTPVPLHPTTDEWRQHLALPGKDCGCAAREVWTGHPSTLNALWDARAMLQPRNTHQVDLQQVTSDFAGI
eukprot:13244237-Heterocapsa_arctica.AAC.1